jgi:hypothetical protein
LEGVNVQTVSADSYLTISLGFFAGVSLGLTVTVGVMIWLFKLLQSNVIHQTVSDLLEDSQGLDDEDSGTELDEAAETQEEWWKN